jgi:hypothetical protein
MLVLYKNKPTSNCVQSSRPTSSRSGHNGLAMEVRNKKNPSMRSHSNFPVQRMHNAVAKVATDDVFSGHRGARPQMPRVFEDLSSNVFRQIGDVFGKMAFGNIGGHTPVSRNHGASKVISRTYVLSAQIDQNGRMYAEKYFSNDVAMRGVDGTTIHERQQAYHNTGNNVQKIAEERRINNQGKRLVQQRIKGQDAMMKQIQYHNMHEDEIDHFDQRWDHCAAQFGFYNGSRKRVVQDPQDVPFIPSSRNQYDSAPQRDFQLSHRGGNVQNSPARVRRAQNRNRANNIDNDHGYGRVRRSDIQPAIPDRVLALPRNETHNDAPVRPVNGRQNQGQHHAPEPVNEQHAEQNHVDHEPVPRVRTANAQRRSNVVTGARGDGNFKNKHIPIAMPDAG